ncbi:MAG: COX15/CtaA family protein [Candidatus Omnitrophica bacterium]|nr:COX15/CtaA family protein [Candidatus Omnitrophota bacterium]
MTTSGTSTGRPGSRDLSRADSQDNPWLRRYTKLTVTATLFLIFAGGMVTSTGSGLSVPDWPLSYGTLFPPMVGGVFYEHGHRMIATCVGALTLCLAIWLAFAEVRKWIKVVGFCALGAVILQGVLGGITVLFYLPTPVSVAHGVLAQTFFLMTIFLAYSQSVERRRRQELPEARDGRLQAAAILMLAGIYVQLILGAVMRHTGSGLAVYDFPTMAGQWWPTVNDQFLARVNDWRFEHGLDPIARANVLYHLAHRFWAVILVIIAGVVNMFALRCRLPQKDSVLRIVFGIDAVIATQVFLGIATVLTGKGPLTTSLHVVTGAALLGLTFLLLLRIAPLRMSVFMKGHSI